MLLAVLLSIQLIQMVVGAVLIGHNVLVCPKHIPSLVFMVLVYLSFIALFGQLFWDNYCRKRPNRGPPRVTAKPTTESATKTVKGE